MARSREPGRAPESARQFAVDRSLRALAGHTGHLRRAVTLAHDSFAVPFAQLNLLDHGRLVSLAHVGRSSDGLMHSLSGLVALRNGPLLVADAASDPRFASIPETRGADAIRFYAGHPVRSDDGYSIGVLCVLDTEPHEVMPGDWALIHDIALLVEGELIALLTRARRRAAAGPA